MDLLVSVVAGYLLGSVPFGVIVGRMFGGVDVREFGSGRTGMTNVLRTVGVWAAALVLALDMGKAAAAVVVARVLSDSAGAEAAAGIAALAGHNWPVFVGFRGGRGVASGLGALYIISPVSGLVATLVGVPIIAIWRYASLGSMLGATSGSVTLVVLCLTGFHPLGYAWYALAASPLIVAKHSDNIVRLLKGEERKVGSPASEAGAQRVGGKRRGFRWPRSA